MYNILYDLYFSLRRIEKQNTESNNLKIKISRKLIGYIEAYYNLYVVKKYKKQCSKESGITTSKRNQKIIVSLTSFPKRIGTLWITVETLLRQSMKPDEIVLWLAKEQFEGLKSLPIELLEQQKRGLTIRFCDDLRSHKKYYYTMQEFSEDLIILVDDDTFYPYDTVEKLVKMHEENPEEIVCMTPTLITNFSELPSVWKNPGAYERVKHSLYAQPYTGQGTLYPPHCMDEEFLFRKDLIMELCPYADDLWLKYMSLRKETLVSAIWKYRSIPITIYGTSESSLWYINGQDGKNDEQWKNILAYFDGEVIDGMERD